MINSLPYNYIIIILNIINLTLRFILTSKNLTYNNYDFTNFNMTLNEIFSTDSKIYESGSVDINCIINSVLSFYLGYRYGKCCLFNLIISIIIFEMLLIYNGEKGKILINLLLIIIFNILGIYFKKDRYKVQLNIPEYDFYKLY